MSAPKLGPDEFRAKVQWAVDVVCTRVPEQLIELAEALTSPVVDEVAPEVVEEPAPETPVAPETVEEAEAPAEAPETPEEPVTAPEDGDEPAPTVDWAEVKGEAIAGAIKAASDADLKVALEDSRKGVREAAQAELDARAGN